MLFRSLNTINAPSSGGLIWLSFIQNESPDPKGVAKITFTDASEQIRAPWYVFGTTSYAEFQEMLTTYSASTDVLYTSDYVAIAATKEAAGQYSRLNDKNAWMTAIHTLLEKEDEISGMDNNDPNPIHHRFKPGEVRYLLVENTSSSPHASSAGYTGYPNGSRSRYLTIFSSGNNSWMLGHELGHQHQQPAYMISKAVESTVNIYSYVVERNIQGANYTRTTAAKWTAARNTYLKLPFSTRIYDMDDNALQTVTGFNRDELRFMPWEQLFLIFGDQFYKTLHRVVREEKVSEGGGADERRAYLILKASQITGYDLTEFFNIWGIRVDNASVKANLRARMAAAKSNSEILDLSAIGRTVEDLVNITGQVRPPWAPIVLRGITTSAPELPIDRSGWSIVTSHVGASDGTVGGNKPEYIIDESTVTSFAFVKPGKTYDGIAVPEGDEISFTIDMKTPQTFNYVGYTHRFSGNVYELLRARQISVYGSDNGVEFTAIKEHHEIDYIKNDNEIHIEFPQVTCRYIKVVIEDWNKDGGNTIQVADFKIGTQPVLIPVKFRVNVTADSGIVTSQTGINLEDEDSNYTINFTLTDRKSVV